jgi:hypothetical protein
VVYNRVSDDITESPLTFKVIKQVTGNNRTVVQQSNTYNNNEVLDYKIKIKINSFIKKYLHGKQRIPKEKI